MKPLERYLAQKNRKDAKAVFLEAMEDYRPRIEASRQKMRDIYAFKTPSSPFVECEVTDAPKSGPPLWAAEGSEEERNADAAMRSALSALALHPRLDVVPGTGLGHGNSDMISSLYGLTFDVTREGAVMNREYLFDDVDALVAGVADMPEIDVTMNPRVQGYVKRAAWIASEFPGVLETFYPQMQGPLTNAARTMPQEEMLIACAVEPEAVKALVDKQAAAQIRIMRLLRDTVDNAVRMRPRARFYQPEQVSGLYVDDYLSVISPEQYKSICSGAWQAMADAFGGVFFHTCGPVYYARETMRELPGLKGFEFAFADGQRKSTRDVEALVQYFRGAVVVNSFMLPFGNAVADMDNFSYAWVEKTSRGGGFAVQFSATTQELDGFFAGK